MPVKRLDPSGFQRILIIATRQIGDVLCTTPLMRRAREIWPLATIDVLGYEKTMGMLKGNPDINDVIESSEHPKWPEYRQLLKRIFRRYDLAIVTQASDRAHIYGLLAAPSRVGIVPVKHSHTWWKRRLSLYALTGDARTQHVVADRLRLLEPFMNNGVGPSDSVAPSRIGLVPPDAESLPPAVERWVVQGSFLVVHATPMWRYKQWPVNHWVTLVSALVDKGYRLALTGSSAQHDVEINESIRSGLGEAARAHVENFAGQLTLPQTTTLLRAAKAFIGVDTSITHQAAASGVPTIALFGPTDPVYFGPWPADLDWGSDLLSPWKTLGEQAGFDLRVQMKKNVMVVQGPGRCVPCLQSGCLDTRESHSECLDRLSPVSLMKVIENRL